MVERTLGKGEVGSSILPGGTTFLQAFAMAELILAVHLLIIAFNVLGLVAIPVGASLRWAWVRGRKWRALHVVSWAVVALQALVGRACFLTLMQADAASSAERTPLIARWVNSVVYWPLPLWAFTVTYVLLFALVLWLWRAVPPRPWRRPGRG